MKLIEALKHGINTGDWEVICQIYKSLTGEEIAVPKAITQSIDDIEIQIPTTEVFELDRHKKPRKKKVIGEKIPPNDRDKKPEPLQGSTTTINDSGVKTKSGRRVPMSTKHFNKFYDDGTEAAADLRSQNPSLSKMYVQPRPRDKTGKSDKIKVTCSLCGKIELVSQTLAQGCNDRPDENTYKCNQCCTSNGRVQLIRQGVR
jgi:hypothetical protein